MRLGRIERCSSAVEVRKGAWTAEEDILLKKCVAKYGEGKWHLVPCRAGLNRCRKSCRLRWMNYLKPDIKRGKFSVDEVDLILRLHKLLGNRWSLIAGRIPGRTANDVKNYWNTHRRKIELKSKNDDENNKKIVAKATETNNDNDNERHNNIVVTNTNIIRPRPRIFKPQHLPLDIIINNNNKNNVVESPIMQVTNDMSFNVPAPVSNEDSSATNYWLETIKSLSTSCGFDIINSDSDPNIEPISDYYHIESDDKINKSWDTTISTVFIEDDTEICWTDFLADMDLWDVTADGEIK